MIRHSASNFWKAFKSSVSKFSDDNAIKLSASLSYYTIFAMPPMLMIIINFSGFFFGKDAIQGTVYGQLSGLVGPDAALAIQDILKNVHLARDSMFTMVISIVTLVVGATGMFTEIQDSINSIWGIKAKPKKGWLKWLLNRLLSFSMVVTIGFLLLVSLIINTLMDILSARLEIYFSNLTVQLVYILNLFLVFSVITVLFAIVFKALPDGKVYWKDALKGASFTALLFMIGKFLIGYYLGHSSVTSLYGAAGSIIVVLLWVYYSSIILYFGAEFTMVYACMFGKKIVPYSYSVFVVAKEIEKKEKTEHVRAVNAG